MTTTKRAAAMKWYHGRESFSAHVTIFLLMLLVSNAGCAIDQSMNPAFPITRSEARQHLDEMHATPVKPERPVIVAAGFMDPGFISRGVVRRLRHATDRDASIVSVSFFWAFNFDACRDRLIERVQRAFPSDDPDQTVEVDVIGYSMGGLVARYAAMPRSDGRRLAIHRLYTISTPHRGARLASIAPFDARARNMTAGAGFLARLDEDLARGLYEVVPYVRTGDVIVGEENAAPFGQSVLWVPNKRWSMAHNNAGSDERIIADIARRLRGEKPLTRDSAAPATEDAPHPGALSK